MKSISKLFLIFLTLFFIWMMIVTVIPIKPAKLENKFQVCDVNKINTWKAVQAKPSQVKSSSFAFSQNDFIEFTFEKVTDRPLLECLKNIPVSYLYRAKTINATVQVNQPINLSIGLHRVGMGAGWSGSIRPEDINKPVTLTWPLDKEGTEGEPKINWLSGDYEGGSVSIDKFDNSTTLDIIIYEIYIN